MRPAPVAALLALVALTGLPAVGPAPAAQEAPGAPKELVEVERVLDARAIAVEAGAEAAFLATVDPEAPPEFRAAQARSFQGLSALPLASYELDAHVEDTGDLSRAAAGQYGGAPVFLPETRQRYRLQGFDDRDAVDHLWLTFVQRDGQWYVGGDDDLEAVGLETGRNIWDLGPVRAQPTEHFLLLSHPEDAARADALGQLAEQAFQRLGQVWDQSWSGRVPLVLPGSVEELETLLQSTVDLDKFLAFAAYGLQEDKGYGASAPRIFVQDDRLSRYPPASQVETLLHELVHVAAAPLAGPFVPLWAHEGVADWAATGRPASERVPAGSDGRLPLPHELAIGPAASISRSYRESRSAVSYLAARSGPGAPSAFFRALGEYRVHPGSVEHHVDAALRRTGGVGFTDFERSWATRR